jgi:hypothetical protein
MRPYAIALASIALPLTLGMGEAPVELKHFSIVYKGGWAVSMSAENMAREASVLHLRGNVEIKTAPRPGEHDQFVLLRADDADFHIDTGAIEPRGNVNLRPQPDDK